MKLEYSHNASGNDDLRAVRCKLESYINRGEYLSAYSLIRSVLHQYPDDIELLRSYALCMSRLGMCREAIGVLEGVSVGNDNDPEIFSQLGGIYKTAWLDSCCSEVQNPELLQKTFEYYNQSYESDGNHWSGINVATLAMLLGNEDRACSVADEVITKCWNIYNNQGTCSQFWIPATLAEAYLVKGDIRNSVNWYQSASHHLGEALGYIRTTVTNMRLLIEQLNLCDDDRNLLLSSLKLPRIGLFFRNRYYISEKSDCFPDEHSERALVKLRRALAYQRLNVMITGITDGIDIIMLECLQNMGKKTYVVLPSLPEYVWCSFLKFSDEKWIHRFDSVLANASGIEILSSARFDGESTYIGMLTDDLMLRFAIDKAEHLGGELAPVEISIGKSKRSERTSHMLSRLASVNCEPICISFSEAKSVRSSQINKHRRHSDLTPVTDMSDERFPPRQRLIVVISLGDISSKTEAEVTDLIGEIGNIVSAHTGRTISQLSGGILTDRVYVLLSKLDDALGLEQNLRSADSCRDLPILIHADIAVRISHDVGMYCRSLGKCLQLVELIQPGSTCSTMQVRACDYSLEDKVIFSYRGDISLEDTTVIHLYEVINNSSYEGIGSEII